MRKKIIVTLIFIFLLSLTACNNPKPNEVEQGEVSTRDLEFIQGTRPTQAPTETEEDTTTTATGTVKPTTPNTPTTNGGNASIKFKKVTFPSYVFEADIPSDFTLERLNDYFYVLIGEQTRIFITYTGGSYSSPSEVYDIVINRYNSNLEFEMWTERLKGKDKKVYYASPNTFADMKEALYSNTKCMYNEFDVNFKSTKSHSLYHFDKALRSYGYFLDGEGGFSTLAISDKYSTSELLKIQNRFLSTVKKLNTDTTNPEGIVETYKPSDDTGLSFNYPSSFTKVNNSSGMVTLKAAYNSAYEGITINYYSDADNTKYTDAGSFTTELGSELFIPLITDIYVTPSHYSVYTTIISTKTAYVAGSQGLIVKTYENYVPKTMGANDAIPSFGNFYVSYRYVTNKGTTPVALIFTAPYSKEALLDKLINDYADSFK